MTTPAPDAPPTPPAVLPEAVARALSRIHHESVLTDPAARRVFMADADAQLRAAIASALADAHAAGYRAALDDVAAEVAQMGGGR